jgi:hypothetical protein
VILSAFGGREQFLEKLAGMAQPIEWHTSTSDPDILARVQAALMQDLDANHGLAAILCAGLRCDADFVLPLVPPDPAKGREWGRKLNLSIGDWHDAKQGSEIFVRGHDVPWAFSAPGWWHPWNGFYSTVEPPEQLLLLWRSCGLKGLKGKTVELARSLALNRHPNIAFTRDRLHYYVQQQSFSRRRGFFRQDFSFESSYYLNHYYLLLWGGLDQVCWIVNAVFNLGLGDEDHRKIGVLNRQFVALLKEGAPAVHRLVVEPKFNRWAQVIRSARHRAAHGSVTQASRLMVKEGAESTEQELRDAVERSDEWSKIQELFPPDVADGFKEQLLFEEKLRRYKEAPHRVMEVQVDGQPRLTFPLLNVEFDFRQFHEFSSGVAHERVEHLGTRGSEAAQGLGA